MPIQLLILCALCAMVLIPAGLPSAQAPPQRGRLFAQLVVVAAGLAALRSCNSWDWPTYLGLAILSCALAAVRWNIASARPSLPGWMRAGLIVAG
ncbi:MAG: hypothetical protein IPN40_07050 [Uliginosibacterium sp.]|nr:hypothetical protein [Uliginosibacterium sp.]